MTLKIVWGILRCREYQNERFPYEILKTYILNMLSKLKNKKHLVLKLDVKNLHFYLY